VSLAKITLNARGVPVVPTRVFNIEHGKAAYWADFGIYGFAIVALLIFLVMSGEKIGPIQMIGFSLAGLVLWTFLEYVLHRFVLHGIEPFKTLHAMHHMKPRALIFAPTILSGTLIGLLIFAPALLMSSALRATSLTVGLLIGYLGYAVTHHAIHHWPRKRIHALHHMQKRPAHFGVTSMFWDRVFGSHLRAHPRDRYL
jgi:sterol desaturase/sphingolipid hydroxylase (fatty acid hydroxylase superfamily)